MARSNTYAVKEIDGNLKNLQPATQHVTYTVFDQPMQITDGTYTMDFTYGHDDQRRMTVLKNNGTTAETWVYFGSFEEKRMPNGDYYQHCYVNSPDGVVALYRRKNTGSYAKYNILKDHLGSVTGLITNSGTISQEYSYDAWGRIRKPTDWTYYPTGSIPANLYTNRGYTFHEMLNSLNLINANGRLYDPLVGRFLSPDNNVQAPGLAQNFNRYSYCLNNPLTYNDPDGEFFAMPAIAFFTFAEWACGTSSLKTSFNNAVDFVNYASNAIKFNFNLKNNTSVTFGFDIMNVNLYCNATAKVGDFTFSRSAGINLFGLYARDEFSQKLGNFQITRSISFSNFENPESGTSDWTPSFGAGISYYDEKEKIGGSVGFTAWGGPHSQANWYVGIRYHDFSFKMTNDYKMGGDKWRTAAAEIGYKDISAGFNIYTTKPSRQYDKTWVSRIWGPHAKGLGAYVEGSRLQSPFYLGYKFNGMTNRIGVDSPWVQDLFQNWKHHNMKNAAYFRTDYDTPSKLYLYSGLYNPFALY